MSLLLITAMCLSIIMFIPSMRDTVLHLILCAFSFPVLTFTGGTLGWLALNMATGFSQWTPEGWINSCAWFGLPIAAVGTWWVRRSY